MHTMPHLKTKPLPAPASLLGSPSASAAYWGRKWNKIKQMFSIAVVGSAAATAGVKEGGAKLSDHLGLCWPATKIATRPSQFSSKDPSRPHLGDRDPTHSRN